MSTQRFCNVFALVVAVLTGYACVATFLLSTSEVQVLVARVVRPEIDFACAIFMLHLLAALGLAFALSLLAVAQLIPQEISPPSRLVRAKNRVDQVCVVGTEENRQSLHEGVLQS
jgi:hypothetical protein